MLPAPTTLRLHNVFALRDQRPVRIQWWTSLALPASMFLHQFNLGSLFSPGQGPVMISLTQGGKVREHTTSHRRVRKDPCNSTLLLAFPTLLLLHLLLLPLLQALPLLPDLPHPDLLLPPSPHPASLPFSSSATVSTPSPAMSAVILFPPSLISYMTMPMVINLLCNALVQALQPCLVYQEDKSSPFISTSIINSWLISSLM